MKSDEGVAEETVTGLAGRHGVRVERIVSRGQRSRPDAWYDQHQTEWVMVLEGRARLEIEGEDDVAMEPGDWLEIPARVRHRVAWTDPDRPTLWLAVFYD